MNLVESPEGYELALKNWARKVLSDRHLDQTEIRNVSLDFGHDGGCFGFHDPDEYCECDPVQPYIEATIYYFNGTNTCLHQAEIHTNIDRLFREILECQLGTS